MNYPGIENHISFFIIFNVVEDPGCVKPVEVVDEPLPDMEELHLADGELVEGDLLVNQPQLHYQGDDDGAVDRIPFLLPRSWREGRVDGGPVHDLPPCVVLKSVEECPELLDQQVCRPGELVAQRVEDGDGGVPQVYLNQDPVIGILVGSCVAVDAQWEKNPFFLHNLLVKSNFLQTKVKIVPTFLPKGTTNRKKDAADLGVHVRGEDVGVEVPRILVSGDGVEVTSG